MNALVNRLTLRANEPMMEALRRDGIGDFRALSAFAASLTPLLHALDWRGSRRHLVEALPHFANDLDLTDLRNVLSELGYPTQPVTCRLADLDPRLAPCLFVMDSGRPYVVVRSDGHTAFVHVPEEPEPREITTAGLRGIAYVVVPEAARTEVADDRSFMRLLGLRFRNAMLQMLGLTLAIDGVTLVASLASMLIYDKVIGARAPDFLGALAIGIAILFFCDWLLRVARLRMIAFVGARIDRLIGVAALRQLLSLPLASIESAPVGTQASRLREFEAVRDIFVGPLAQFAVELPFFIVAVFVLSLIAGPLALVPAALVVIFAITARLIFPTLRAATASSGRVRAQRHGFLVEMVGGLRAIRQTGVEATWLERYRDLSAECATSQDHAQQWSLFTHTLSQILVLAAGVATLAFGIMRVLSGAMTVGALVATMAIVWRVLAPLQLGLVLLPRFEGVLRAVNQINNLMRIKPLRPSAAPVAHVERVFRGDLQAIRISHRYRADTDPALLGADLAAKRGEIVAVVGASGSGKSTLLKIMAGLYQPQGGAVTIDGIDIRQLPPGDLQRAICYLPQNSHLFHGTIEQNLRLADPSASAHDLMMALEAAAAVDDVEALKDGIATRIGDQRTQQLPAGLLQRLSLARVFLTSSPIILLDEPGQALDEHGDTALKNMLHAMRGRRTVIIVTHRPSHIALVDRVVMLADGRVARDLSAADFLKFSKGGPR
jgi:ATP-binding cassette subfamily C protein/ATP-binding cassette subfamily C protein LapB